MLPLIVRGAVMLWRYKGAIANTAGLAWTAYEAYSALTSGSGDPAEEGEPSRSSSTFDKLALLLGAKDPAEIIALGGAAKILFRLVGELFPVSTKGQAAAAHIVDVCDVDTPITDKNISSVGLQRFVTDPDYGGIYVLIADFKNSRYRCPDLPAAVKLFRQQLEFIRPDANVDKGKNSWADTWKETRATIDTMSIETQITQHPTLRRMAEFLYYCASYLQKNDIADGVTDEGSLSTIGVGKSILMRAAQLATTMLVQDSARLRQLKGARLRQSGLDDMSATLDGKVATMLYKSLDGEDLYSDVTLSELLPSLSLIRRKGSLMRNPVERAALVSSLTQLSLLIENDIDGA
jgi:hypothetical protein